MLASSRPALRHSTSCSQSLRTWCSALFIDRTRVMSEVTSSSCAKVLTICSFVVAQVIAFRQPTLFAAKSSFSSPGALRPKKLLILCSVSWSRTWCR